MPESTDSRLARIEEKLDLALPQLIKHEERLATLERWRAYVLGACAACGVLIGYLFKTFDHKN